MAAKAPSKNTPATQRTGQVPKQEKRLSDKELQDLFEPCWCFQAAVRRELSGKAFAEDLDGLMRKIENDEWDRDKPRADQVAEVLERQVYLAAKAAFEAGFTLGRGGKGKGQGHRDMVPRKYGDVPTLEEWLVRDIQDHGFNGSQTQRILKVVLDLGAKGEFLKEGYKSVVFDDVGRMISVESDRNVYRADTFEVTGSTWVDRHENTLEGIVRRANRNMKGHGAEFWRSARVRASVYSIDRSPTSSSLGMSPRPTAPTEDGDAWKEMLFYWEHYLTRDLDLTMEARSTSSRRSERMGGRKKQKK